MSEYQRYEFMIVDRPLTPTQLDAVNHLSSHIAASSTHALIEYHWGDFKHDPISVLYEFFDGFLYWANWGTPRLAFRFPHGAFSADFIDRYDFEDFVTFTRHQDYDILDIHFGEMEAPGEWTEYNLGSLIAIREELMEGDLRALYITWLAAQEMIGGYGEEEEDYEEEEGYDKEKAEDYEIDVPPVPPAFGALTAAQQALAELLQMPQELLSAAAQHSDGAPVSSTDDFAAWIKLLSPERRNDYLVRLARNEPGLSRLLVKELRELGRGKTSAPPPEGERVPYATLLKESEAIAAQLERAERERQARLERERREQAELARQRRLEDVHNHPETFWRQVEQAVGRGTAVGYKDAVEFLVDLRDAAARFNEVQEFQTRFHAWVRPHLRRPAFVRRLQEHRFTLPEA